MVDKIKMATKHEFSIAQSIFIQINRNLGFGMNILKKNIIEVICFQNFKMADYQDGNLYFSFDSILNTFLRCHSACYDKFI
jgi:hypothetical protein